MNQAPDDNQQTILLVDDDEVFVQVLSQAMVRRHFNVFTAVNAEQALELARQNPVHKAVVDLRLGEDSGLVLVDQLLQLQAQMQIVVLTGYASIATAVEAIKLGAIQYLAKPATAQQILAAFSQTGADPHTQISEHPMSPSRLEWEHIQRVLADCDGNISAAARSLGMHRRTLQRKLAKKPSKR